jgi:hypothetical protein
LAFIENPLGEVSRGGKVDGGRLEAERPTNNTNDVIYYVEAK